MRHDPASAAIVIMLRSLKMHGMAQAVAELTEQGSNWPKRKADWPGAQRRKPPSPPNMTLLRGR